MWNSIDWKQTKMKYSKWQTVCKIPGTHCMLLIHNSSTRYVSSQSKTNWLCYLQHVYKSQIDIRQDFVIYNDEYFTEWTDVFQVVVRFQETHSLYYILILQFASIESVKTTST